MAFGCECRECRLPKRRRRGQPVVTLCEELEPLPRTHSFTPNEPLFVLERLAHIRTALLTLSTPCGLAPIARATVEIHGQVVAASCVLADSDGVTPADSSSALPPLSLRLDLGEPVGDVASASVTVQNGYAYIRLPLGASSAFGAVTPPGLVDGLSANPGTCETTSPFEPLQRSPREESGLCERAAFQRRRERCELPCAPIHCRRCGTYWLSMPSIIKSMPDVDAASMVDFAQCCQDIDFDWRCVFPEAKEDGDQFKDGRGRELEMDELLAKSLERSRKDVCYSSDHALHFDVPPPPALRICTSPSPIGYDDVGAHHFSTSVHGDNIELAGVGRSSDGDGPFSPPWHVHSRAFAEDTPTVWAPLQCVGCGEVVGATVVQGSKSGASCGDGGADLGEEDIAFITAAKNAQEPEIPSQWSACVHTVVGAPLWFEERVPAKCRSTMQLLKAASSVGLVSAPLHGGDVMEPPMIPEEIGRTVEDPTAHRATRPHSRCTPLFDGFCMSTIVAWRMLREAVDGFEDAPTQSRAESTPRLSGESCPVAGPLHFALCDLSSGLPVTLLTLLSQNVTVYTNQDVLCPGSATRRAADGMSGTTRRPAQDALKVLYCEADGQEARVTLSNWHAGGALRLLWLNRTGCSQILTQLCDSTRLIPPRSRQLGAFSIGYLPVAPTWD
mgnify:CR=1 FL=1